ncbi:MAG: hypothetical protein QXL94_01745 [Candidatus Parvarchaeum sp.]
MEKELASKDFIVGVPSGHLAYSNFYMHLIQWMSGSPVMPVISISNRVDVNRSQIITAALKTQRNIVYLDYDALPMQDYKTMMSYLLEDFKTYDIVVAPVRGVDGNILIKPLNADFKFPQHAIDYKPFEIEAGSFTFAGVSYNLLKQLKPLSQYGLVDNRTVPLYVAYNNQTSEEYAFCHKAKKQYHAKIACDPRLRVSHFKAIPLPPPIPMEEMTAIQKQSQNSQPEKLIL